MGDGAGKVVTGATGLIMKRDRGDDGDQYEDYNAKNLISRRQNQSLLDRVSGVVRDEKSEEKDESERKQRVNMRKGTSSLLVPMSMMPATSASAGNGGGGKGSWDF